MKTLVVHDSDGVYNCFTGTLAEINDSLRGSAYWARIVQRLEHLTPFLLEEEITVKIIDDQLHHDGDSELGFTLLEPIAPTIAAMTLIL